jgi:hypothetical protein
MRVIVVVAMKILLKLFVCSLVLAAVAVRGEDFTFETSNARYVLGGDGTSKSLRDKQTQKEWLAPNSLPMFVVRKLGKEYPASEIKKADNLLRVSFGASEVSANFSITIHPDYLLVELVSFQGTDVEEIRIAQMPVLPQNAGSLIAVRSNDQFTISLMGFSQKVDTKVSGLALVASVYPQFGMQHEKVAIIAVPTTHFYDAVQTVESDGHLPSPHIDGQWAKLSQASRTSYLFTDLTEANADETIRYAKLAGFPYILIYAPTWASSNGSYPINVASFPHGEAGLKAVIDKCHAAGLKVGMHMLTSEVGKKDPLVHPHPDPRLLKDASAALAADISASASELTATGTLTDFASEGHDIQIDDEIIQYRVVSGSKFLGVTRGFVGTVPAAHRAGARIYHLVERNSAYLADLNTALKDVIADRIAGIVNHAGFDMIYFDGGNVNVADGPAFYYLGLQQQAIYDRIRRDVLFQGSGISPYSWHIITRGTCDDFAALGTKQYLDIHKIGLARANYLRSFLPAELGWWGLLAATPDHPATTPDEIEFLAVRMLALDAPASIETTLQSLQANGRTDEMLQLLDNYEKLRLSGQVPQSIRENLRQGEWHLIQRGGKPEFHPVRYTAVFASAPEQIPVNNEFGSQPLKFRVGVLPALMHPGDPQNIVLYSSKQGLDIKPPVAGAKMPGALGARVQWAVSTESQPSSFVVGAEAEAAPLSSKSINLLHHQALLVTLDVQGPLPTGLPAVLNIQLETSTKVYRDFYVELASAGRQTVRLEVSTPGRALTEFPAAYSNYPYKAAMRYFQWDDIRALNFRWMRQPGQPVACRVISVEAANEVDYSADGMNLSIGSSGVTVPAGLGSGSYAEFWADGVLRTFDQNGNLLSTIRQTAAPPILQSGQNIISFSSRQARTRLTVITLGPALAP